MLHRPRTKDRIFSSGNRSASSVASADIGAKFTAIQHTPTQLKAAIATYIVIEFVVIICSNLFALYFYHNFILRSWSWHQLTNYTPAAVFVAFSVLIISLSFRNYSSIRRTERGKFLWSGIGAISLAFSFFLTFLFFTQFAELYSRGTLAFQFIASCIAVGAARELFVSFLHSATRSGRVEARRIALIGDGNLCAIFAARLKSNGIRTVNFFCLPKNQTAKDKTTLSAESLKLSDKLRALRLDDIIILANKTITPEMLKLTKHLAELPASVHLLPTESLDIIASAKITQFGNLRTIELFQPPLTTVDIVIKRIFDLAFATASLIILSPLFLIVSLAIKLELVRSCFFSASSSWLQQRRNQCP